MSGLSPALRALVASCNNKYSNSRYRELLIEQQSIFLDEARELREDADHLERMADLLREEAECFESV